MKMESYLEYVTKETIDNYANIHCIIFGDILIEALGINGDCVVFCKCKDHDDLYNLGWALENGQEYMHSYSLDEILRALKNKKLTLTTKVERI